MTPRRRPAGRLTAAVALAGLASFAAAPQAAAKEPCSGAAERHLQSLDLGADEVVRTDIIAVIPIPEFNIAFEYQAWTKLKSCSGALVTKFTQTCQVKETYARGECRTAGVLTN